jgi:hypothetical protein
VLEKFSGYCRLAMANTLFSGHIFYGFRSSSNLRKNFELLCIRGGNLKFAKFHKSYANLKKIGYPNFLAG